MYNNIFYLKKSRWAQVIAYQNITLGMQFSNYNDIYSDTCSLLIESYPNASPGDQYTLAAWTAASGLDSNSISTEPVFYSQYDLHCNDASIDNKGTPLSQITDDIDDEPRSLTTPDIGADEFSYNIYVPVIHVSSHLLNIHVYPNPATDNITFETVQEATIVISNMEGQVIKSFKIKDNSINIDISGFSSGVYIIQAMTEKELMTRKFVKE
jgi:hypothetical protein